MSYKYKAVKMKNGINEKESFYPVPANGIQVDTEFLAKEIAFASSLTPGDVMATIEALRTAIIRSLQMGRTIKLDKFGVFSMSITSQPESSPEDLLPHKVKMKKVCFRADKRMNTELKHTQFERKQ